MTRREYLMVTAARSELALAVPGLKASDPASLELLQACLAQLTALQFCAQEEDSDCRVVVVM